MAGLKARAKTLEELADNARSMSGRGPCPIDEKAAKLLTPAARGHARGAGEPCWPQPTGRRPALEAAVRSFAEAEGLKLGQVAQPLRAALTGSTVSPGDFRGHGRAGPAEDWAA